ncbi:hypothetical protein JYU34_018411 [Plutella xylostella]|uniref:BDBT FKBP like N-terminal domain-containing protein n=1 Tax=Plutella xylostella TaxID=51655 RepID=A0ABQ7PY87_PLUXY|nr:hypothetical protein JYU34_018411 [Plutella xylostella]
MPDETIVSARPDRELKKKIITPGDYNVVPYEDSRCKVSITNLKCFNESGDCAVDPESQVFSAQFNGIVLIGDSDSFIDKDFELILQQMCNGEVCEATMTYRDCEGKLAAEYKFTLELKETTVEQLVSDWGWMRLYEAATHHKERGVELVKQKRMADAFRRFSKALKMLIAIEPIDLEEIPEESVKEMKELKVKLLNNLAHCQIQYNEFEAALDLCNRALKYDPDNIKTYYRRCVSYQGLNLYEEAWNDIQHVLKLDPSDRAAQQKASLLKPKVDEIKTKYANVMKKMFV